MKWFLPFLGIIFFSEMISAYHAFTKARNTLTMNYLVAVTESIFYSYIFYHLTNNQYLKKGILFFAPVSVIGYLIAYLLGKGSYSYFFTSLIVSGFFISVIALCYLYLKLANNHKTALIYEPGFWIALGVSVFYSGVSIVFAMYDLIIKNDLRLFGVRLYHLVPKVLSVVLYVNFSISIVLSKRKSLTV